jgi:hypothetical protein
VLDEVSAAIPRDAVARNNAIANLNPYAFKLQRKSDFALNTMAAVLEVMCQTCLIGRFQQPRSQCPVYFECRVDDVPGNFVRGHENPALGGLCVLGVSDSWKNETPSAPSALRKTFSLIGS